MASLRQLRSQIKSVQSTQQIMRAMQMVSASKLQRAQARLFAARPGLAYLDGVVQRLLADQQARGQATATHPFFDQRQPRGTQLLTIITSDAGLCSTYNAHLLTTAEQFLEARPREERWQVIPVGKRGARFFAKRRWPVLEGWLELGGRPNPVTLRAIGANLVERFTTRAVDGVAMAYTRFVSPMVYRPTVERMLPLVPPPAASPSATARSRDRALPHSGRAVGGGMTPAAVREGALPDEYIYEPTPQRVLDVVLPLWVETKMLVLLLEAFTSEHSARMIAMKNASDNAKEMMDSLTLTRNKIRQAAITRELAEIVGTAEALK